MSNDATAAVDPLRTPKELCRQGHFSNKTLQRLEKAGEAPRSITITPNIIRYRQSDIDAWLASRTRTVAKAPGRTPVEAIEELRNRRTGR